MEPSQAEEDWMLTVMIKEERKTLAKKYLPQLANYKIEDTCEVCNRYFYQKGNIKSHMEKVHKKEKITQTEKSNGDNEQNLNFLRYYRKACCYYLLLVS